MLTDTIPKKKNYFSKNESKILFADQTFHTFTVKFRF